MSKRMTAQSIINALKKTAQPGLPLTQYDTGFNRAVTLEAKGRRQENYAGNEQYFWDGKFINPGNEDMRGYNDGVDAVEFYKAGKKMTTPEKTEDQQKFDLRLRCFGMAQQSAPQRMHGAQPEPPAETIKRAMFLEHYFTTGQLLDQNVVAAATGKAK